MYMEKEGSLVGVLRIGSRERIEQVARGLLYMNTLEYFIKLEADVLRSDSGEATSHIFRGDGAVLQIKIDGEFRPVGELHGPIRYRSDENLKVNVFCMYALRESQSGVVVDPRNFDFGDTFAVFTDFDEFTRRVQAALVGTGQSAQWAPVDYIDYATYQGPTGVFKKDRSFSYQSELRLALVPGFGTAHQLDVGDLSDIIRIGRSEDLRHITFRRKP